MKWATQRWPVSYLSNPMTLAAMADTGNSIPEANEFLPGAVPDDWIRRDRFLNYQRDTSIPKHRVRWNWIVDLPFGKGKPVLGNAGGILDRIVGAPANYKPAAEPFIPWPKNPSKSDPMYSWYGANTVWVTLKNGTV